VDTTPRERGEPDASPILGKWRVVLGYWAAQGIVFAVLGMGFLALSRDVDGPRGRPYSGGFGDGWEEVVGTGALWGILGIVLGVVMACQLVLVLPVRRPRARSGRGWPLWLSVATAGLAVAALTLAAGATLVMLPGLAGVTIDAPWLTEASLTAIVAAMGLAAWGVSGVLIWRFVRRRLDAGERHEDVLARVAARLFMGTMVEVLAVMPVDVMVRRKTECYCFSGTFWALVLCGPVALVALGPAVLLPLLARRRKRWYAGRCDACGYDLSGLVGGGRVLERCPECGVGWRP
jgi:hypothetical protein